ncbi:MAG TPA: sigma-70 family RNA polymerase sigma factor [Planctomycetota bacterium]|nr:sigma-70 family RNA polymerase sigma factor [Planctomycetota bacterium]
MNSRQPDFPVETLLAQRAWVRALARSLVSDEARSDDLEQRVWLTALKSSPPVLRHPRAWLATILRREAAAERRRDTRRSGREESAARPIPVRSTADVVADAEIHRAVVDAVLALEEPYRSTVLLRYFESLPPREVARRQGVPVETVRARTKRGLAQLRGRLAGRAVAIAAFAGLAGRANAGVVAMRTIRKSFAAVAVVAVAAVAFTLWYSHEPTPANHRASPTAVATVPGAPASSGTVTPHEDVPGASLVRIVGAGGHGISGARVRANLASGAEVARDADTAGVLRLPETGPAVLWVSARGYALRRVERVLSAEESEVVLDKGGRVRLAFDDAAGARRRYEVAGLPSSVQVLPQDVIEGWSEASRGAIPQSEAAQHVACEFEWVPEGADLEPLAAGRWMVVVPRPGATDYVSRVFHVTDDELTTVRVSLPEAAFQRIRILRADTRQPLPGAQVHGCFDLHTFAMATFEGRVRVADERGEVELPLQPDGDYMCNWRIDADGWSGVLGASYPGQVAETTLDVVLSRTWDARGAAYLPDGGPAADRTVFCWELTRLRSTRTDAEGRFSFTGIDRSPSAQATFVLIESRDPPRSSQRTCGDPTGLDKRLQTLRRSEQVAAMALRRDPTNKTITQERQDLQRQIEEATDAATRAPFPPYDVKIGEPGSVASARVEGRITSGGTPLPGVRVSLTSGDVAQRAVTDRDGRFVVERVTGERCDADVIVCATDPWLLPVLRGNGLALRAGEVRRIDLDLPSGETVVTIVDATTGRPIPAAYVHGSPAEECEANRFEGFNFVAGWVAISDENGLARLRCLVPGRLHDIEAAAVGYTGVTLHDSQPGSADQPARLTIRLKPKQ